MGQLENDLANILSNELANGLAGGGVVTLATILGSTLYKEIRANDPLKTLDGSNNVSSAHNYGVDSGDASQGTAAARPAYQATGFNGGPAFVFSPAGSQGLNGTFAASVNGTRPYVFVVGQYTSATAGYSAGLGGDNANGVYINGANWGVQFNTATTETAGGSDTTTRHLIEWSFDGTNKLLIDGVVKLAGDGGTLIDVGNAKTYGVACRPPTLTGAGFVFAHLAIAIGATPAQITAARAFLRGANFPGYTGNSYGTP